MWALQCWCRAACSLTYFQNFLNTVLFWMADSFSGSSNESWPHTHKNTQRAEWERYIQMHTTMDKLTDFYIPDGLIYCALWEILCFLTLFPNYNILNPPATNQPFTITPFTLPFTLSLHQFNALCLNIIFTKTTNFLQDIKERMKAFRSGTQYLFHIVPVSLQDVHPTPLHKTWKNEAHNKLE